MLILPFDTHVPAAREKSGSSNSTRLGFWTGDQFFDKERAKDRYVTDEMLKKFGESGVYLVYSGIRTDEIGPAMIRDFTRCRNHGVEVNIAVSSMVQGDTFVNIWTFERLKDQIEQVLSFLDENGLLGDPVTTLVYDMEPLTNRMFPFYGKDRGVIAGLSEYYRVRKLFHEFNAHVKNDYGLEVRICAETVQAFDPKDKDDDLLALYGVLPDDNAHMSYMIYRRADFAVNYVLDSARYLDPNDTIILNSWKFEGYQCWNDIDCAINEARIVAAYPEKEYGIEVYALCYFLDSFGEDNLFVFIDAVKSDKSGWPKIEVNNTWPYSIKWDVAITLISTLDIYGPIFRAILHAY